ncbi:winged helix-turn-helix domain-containing protein [Tunturibacter empetritectus]|uniref:Tol biopolymer transport system component/DNA-binding winged helix-turn-helix (WHTH) protein n=1 Tax=Tunturiibacter empetritectus TaxID=3069691 RepID=A0A7W8IHP4_9BACT|nr:winged helix-turn-helix domain-containing protein [Edaphobacter lichenicola]MBB5317357.1 Tol biopolymer transport system component/DNA-binding winged helix-turn-helix (wHTH) protein [Edaphobacter lichenicola]
MLSHPEIVSRFGFGVYEADLQTGELWRAGRKIKLQSQPFKVLAVLLEKAGEVVTREELQVRVWGTNIVVDFDHSLGTAINKIRDALGDTADNPRFVETLAKRGYRFIASVTVLGGSLATKATESMNLELTAESGSAQVVLQGPPGTSSQEDELDVMRRRRRGFGFWLWIAMLVPLAVLAGLAGFYYGSRSTGPLPRIERLTRIGRIAPGVQAMESLPASATDGLRIYIPVISGGRSVLAQVDVRTGAVENLPLPSEIASATLGDLSPDGSILLLRSHLSPESEQSLWTVPVGGGSPLRVANVVAHDATWMPDGKSILYATGNQLLVSRPQDGTSSLFAKLPERAFWLRWSPDGKVLRFTLLDPIKHTLGLWEASSDGKSVRPILSNWTRPSSECCGIWTGDGKYFVFQSDRGGSSDLWRLDGRNTGEPKRVTNGPLSFVGPVTSRIGHRIFFLGLETQSLLQRYDAGRHEFVPVPGFLAEATRIEYSRDRQWVIWTDAAGKLWRAKGDGSELIQITPDSLQVFLAHWSPDGKRLAIMAKESGKAWQIYLVPADGGSPERLLRESRNAADPSWSADGQQIAFGRVTDIMGKEDGPRAIQIFDLRTRAVSTVPGSEGWFSPRWSPDGRYIAAVSLDQRKLALFDTALSTWRTIAETTVADPVWSSDGKAIFFHASSAEMQPIYRVSIPGGRLEQIANLSNFSRGDTEDYFFCGLTLESVPIVRSRTRTGNLYTLDLDGP